MKRESFFKKYDGKGIEDDGCVTSAEFNAFARDFKAYLDGEIKREGIKIHSFRRGHYDIVAFVERNGKYLYVSYSVPRGSMPVDFTASSPLLGVLVRAAKGPKDYTGGMNHFCSVRNLGETVCKMIERECRMS